jgi:peptide/nickel transport system permease protein
MKSAVKRVISMIPVLLGVMLLIFIMLRIVPGDPVTVLLGEHYSQETIDRLTAAMKLDRPLLEQFISYVLGVLKGDLGISYVSKRPVTMMILQALPYTVKLALMAAAFAWVIGLFAGIIAAVKENKIPDRIFMAFSLAGVSVPVFMSALLLQYIFAFRLKLFPITSDGSILSMLLPAIALGWNSAGSIARLTRSSLIEVMQADYIDTARAKGLKRRSVIFGHALKNSLLPVITMMAIQLSSMLSGAVITESVFGIPGIGRLATTSISNRDMPLLQGTILFTTVVIILGNLIADLLYSVLDPRIRSQM